MENSDKFEYFIREPKREKKKKNCQISELLLPPFTVAKMLINKLNVTKNVPKIAILIKAKIW